MDAARLNDHLVAYRHRPQPGRTIVFVNGLGCDQTLWDVVIDHLGRGYGTVTYDLRGHGLSGESAAFSLEDLAGDLIALLDHLALRDVLLVGISLGGLVAQQVALSRPDLVSNLVLSNTAARIGDAPRWEARMAQVEAGGLHAIVDRLFELWLAPGTADMRPEAVALWRRMLCRTPQAAYIAGCALLRDADLGARVSGISVPVLCIAGAHDGSVAVAHVRALAQAIGSNARAEVMEGVGHLPPYEAPARMAALIESADAPQAARHDIGMTVRREVLGDAHVDRASAAATALDRPFQSLITEAAWGTVWASHGISRRERSMLTLALLAATGNVAEIPMHIRATRRTGASPRDVQEAFQHVAIYAGVPRANHALKLARETFEDMERDG